MRIKGTLHEDQYIFCITSHSFHLKMRNVSDKSCRENQITHFIFGNLFLKNLDIMRKCGKNIVERDRPQMEIWRMRIEYRIPKATNTHTQIV